MVPLGQVTEKYLIVIMGHSPKALELPRSHIPFCRSGGREQVVLDHLTDRKTEARGCDVRSQRSHSTLGGTWHPHFLAKCTTHLPQQSPPVKPPSCSSLLSVHPSATRLRGSLQFCARSSFPHSASRAVNVKR